MSDRHAAQRLTDDDVLPGAVDRLRSRRRSGPSSVDLGILNDHLGYFIRRVQVWLFQDFIRTLATIDIRPAQYSVLAIVDANPGLSQTDLAEALGIERARLVRVLDKLEARDLVKRLRSPSDRRSHALQLTREGRKILKRAKALANQHEARLAAKLGADAHKQLLEGVRNFRD